MITLNHSRSLRSSTIYDMQRSFESEKEKAAYRLGLKIGEQIFSETTPKELLTQNTLLLEQRQSLKQDLQAPEYGIYIAGWLFASVSGLALAIMIFTSSLSGWSLLFMVLFILSAITIQIGPLKADDDTITKSLNCFDLGVDDGYEAELSKTSLNEWRKAHPLPSSEPDNLHPLDAEYWICDWIKSMGDENAYVTQQSNDGGIDIASPSHIAQVKHYTGSVPISHVRDFIGVVATDKHQRKGMFFNSGKYPKSSGEMMDRLGIAAFSYDVTTASVEAYNDTAVEVLRKGLNPQWQ